MLFEYIFAHYFIVKLDITYVVPFPTNIFRIICGELRAIGQNKLFKYLQLFILSVKLWIKTKG